MIIMRLVNPRGSGDADTVNDHATGMSEVIDVGCEPSAVIPAKSPMSQILSVMRCVAEKL